MYEAICEWRTQRNAIYAEVGWTIDDLLDKFACTEAQAAEWLVSHEKWLRDWCIEAGFAYMEDQCPFPARKDEIVGVEPVREEP
jgi:hypothetical protein